MYVKYLCILYNEEKQLIKMKIIPVDATAVAVLKSLHDQTPYWFPL